MLMKIVWKIQIAFIELFILNYYTKLKKIISKVDTVITLFYPLQNLILGLLEKQLIFIKGFLRKNPKKLVFNTITLIIININPNII